MVVIGEVHGAIIIATGMVIGMAIGAIEDLTDTITMGIEDRREEVLYIRVITEAIMAVIFMETT
jgi:hypothetical protein